MMRDLIKMSLDLYEEDTNANRKKKPHSLDDRQEDARPDLLLASQSAVESAKQISTPPEAIIYFFKLLGKIGRGIKTI